MEEIKGTEETNFEKIILNSDNESSDNESLDNESSDNESSDNEISDNEISDNESLGSISDIEEILSNATLEKQNNEEDYSDLTVNQLKDILSKMNLPLSGNKTKLIQRIKDNK